MQFDQAELGQARQPLPLHPVQRSATWTPSRSSRTRSPGSTPSTRPRGNVLFYFAVAPRFFGLLCDNLNQSGFKDRPRLEADHRGKAVRHRPPVRPASSTRTCWRTGTKSQIYRVDHYLGKETVQNLLAFRFSNGMFEPLWNKNHIDNIQFNVAEAVDVEGRGGYYDQSGVLRDMMQNHMFQMLAYLCMEPPGSFQADAIRNEKAKLLQAVRIYTPEEVAQVRRPRPVRPAGRRRRASVPSPAIARRRTSTRNPRPRPTPPCDCTSTTGGGKACRSTCVRARRSGSAAPRSSSSSRRPRRRSSAARRSGPLGANRLIFHIQPYQGIEIQFQAKIPGPTLQLQPVHMRFGYGDAFKASRYTGYEVMLYSCSRGDATLFSRGDLVEAAWRVAQPLMDYWTATPAADFPTMRAAVGGRRRRPT